MSLPDLLADSLPPGGEFRVRVNGISMRPCLQPGDWLTVRRENAANLRTGDMVILRRGKTFVTHRLLLRRANRLVTKGDALAGFDAPWQPADVIGRVLAVERDGVALPPETRVLALARAALSLCQGGLRALPRRARQFIQRSLHGGKA